MLLGPSLGILPARSASLKIGRESNSGRSRGASLGVVVLLEVMHTSVQVGVVEARVAPLAVKGSGSRRRAGPGGRGAGPLLPPWTMRSLPRSRRPSGERGRRVCGELPPGPTMRRPRGRGPSSGRRRFRRFGQCGLLRQEVRAAEFFSRTEGRARTVHEMARGSFLEVGLCRPGESASFTRRRR
jgi:hypothetical protein